MRPVIQGVFEEFADFTGEKRKVEWLDNIPYKEAMLKYGSDKPDLRKKTPLRSWSVTEVFARDDVEFNAFKNVIKKGSIVHVRIPKGRWRL